MIEAIFTATASGQPQENRSEVEVHRGKGIVGDRHYGRNDYVGQNLTLIEREMIDEYNNTFGQKLTLQDTRRNLITSGVALNQLVGKTFLIGNVEVFGVELCEPCLDLGQLLSNQTITSAKVVSAFTHKGGLRVDVLTDGVIATGMPIVGA